MVLHVLTQPGLRGTNGARHCGSRTRGVPAWQLVHHQDSTIWPQPDGLVSSVARARGIARAGARARLIKCCTCHSKWDICGDRLSSVASADDTREAPQLCAPEAKMWRFWECVVTHLTLPLWPLQARICLARAVSQTPRVWSPDAVISSESSCTVHAALATTSNMRV